MDEAACSAECQAVIDATAGMSVDEIEAELEASGRFSDPAAVAQWLEGGFSDVDSEETPTEEPEEPLG